MTRSCASVGCTNRDRKGSSITFHILPNKVTRKDRHDRWVQAMKRVNPDGSPWTPTSYHVYICSEHFITGGLCSPLSLWQMKQRKSKRLFKNDITTKGGV